MNDTFRAPHSQSPPKPRQPRVTLRGGRGMGPQGVRSKNKTWYKDEGENNNLPVEGRWERGGHTTGRGRGRGMSSVQHTSRANYDASEKSTVMSNGIASNSDHYGIGSVPSGSSKTWEELVKEREEERKMAIWSGKMDDPSKPKRLSEAITLVGTCQDMCPEFERYRRERENNLDKWECIMDPDGRPTKKVDHRRAVKIYERGVGDKIIPSDLRPAPVLKKTLDYLFHDLIPRGGFANTQAFVRDRSRAVRNDFTIQQDTGPVSMECHERCTRFHILSLHLMNEYNEKFDRALEMQQLMNSLLSLKEFYDDQRGKYESPNELEMRIYHRLGLIRDQHERNDKPPPQIAADPVFQLITRFRTEVQQASGLITKVSKLKVSPAAMNTFAELAGILSQRRSTVMIYLIACFLESIFGKDTIDDMESLRGALTDQDLIDGNSEGTLVKMDDSEDHIEQPLSDNNEGEELEDELANFITVDENDDSVNDLIDSQMPASPSSPLKRSATQWLTDNFGSAPSHLQSSITEIPSGFSQDIGSAALSKPATAIFPVSHSAFEIPQNSAFNKLASSSSMPMSFPGSAFSSQFPQSTLNNVFGGPIFGSPSPSTFGQLAESSQQSSTSSASQLLPPSINTDSGLSAPKPEFRSFADAPPLSEGKAEDESIADRESATDTSGHSSLFPVSQSAPLLNPLASNFTPSFGGTPPSSAPLSVQTGQWTPLRSGSQVQSITGNSLRSISTPAIPSPLSLFPPINNAIGSPLTIDTEMILKPIGQTRKAIAIDSPVGPPPLKRQAPISLPSTPTALTSSSHTNLLFAASPANYSPIITIPEPTPFSGHPSASTDSAGAVEMPSSPLVPSTTSAAEEKTCLLSPVLSTDTSNNLVSKEKLRRDAIEFARKSRVVRNSFSVWKSKAKDVVAWKEACRRSESYRQKLSESGELSHSSSFKRRRDSITDAEPARSRRKLKEQSSGQVGQVGLRTDEDLAQRLTQNKKDNERRWARGSFVSCLRDHIRSRLSNNNVPQNWATWLCMNPDNDQTAVWLKQKFDVPSSGNWDSEAVFSIAISGNPTRETFSGLIIFECTRLEDTDDVIERKYRVLDDCARLRDIISELPDRRHYIPSVLFINWDTGLGCRVASDLSDMVAKYILDGVLLDFSVLGISSMDPDLDRSLINSLKSLNLDLSGKLVEWVTLRDIFDQLRTPWQDNLSVWTDSCDIDGDFNWLLYSHILEAIVDCLNSLLKVIMSVWSPNSSLVSPLPKILIKERDEVSVRNSVREWLQQPSFDKDYLQHNINASDFNQEFETRSLIEHVFELAFLYLQKWCPGSSVPRAISKSSIEQSELLNTEQLDAWQSRLRVVAKKLPRSKRYRSINSTSSKVISGGSSPISTVSFDSSKLPRFAMSEVSLASDGPPSPTSSLAPSIADSSTTVVTVAMLRELTRNVLDKYGSTKSSVNVS